MSKVGFLRRGDITRFFKSVMKISRAKRQINYVGDRDQECRAFFEKPSRNGIRVGLLDGAVE